MNIKNYIPIYSNQKNSFKKVENIIKGRTNIVGIQIRCGDKYMATNKRENHTTGTYKNIENYLMAIKNNVTKQWIHLIISL